MRTAERDLPLRKDPAHRNRKSRGIISVDRWLVDQEEKLIEYMECTLRNNAMRRCTVSYDFIELLAV